MNNTDQPAHVPYPKGEIPEEIMQWIKDTGNKIWDQEVAIMEPGENKAEERGYKRGSFHTGAIAVAAIFIAGVAFNLLNMPCPPPYLPPAPGIVLDTSSDSSYLNYRQGSPEGDRRFDSSTRADTLKDGTLEPKHVIRLTLPVENDLRNEFGCMRGEYFAIWLGKICARKPKDSAWIIIDGMAVKAFKQLIITQKEDSL